MPFPTSGETVFTNLMLSPDELVPHGHGLRRPECVLAFSDGSLLVSDSSAAVCLIEPDGETRTIGRMGELPNGLAVTRDGEIIIANIGLGQLYAIRAGGIEEVILEEIDGTELGSVNFPFIDNDGRIWVTVSTRTLPRWDAVQSRVPDGYILCLDADQTSARTVLRGLNFPNELRLDHERNAMYVAETSAGRVLKFDFGADGVPRNGRPYGPDPLFEGALVDGLALDEEGGLWVTDLKRHAIIRIAPDETAVTVIEDPEQRIMSFPTSLAFGGDDRRTVYVGSLECPHLLTFRSPVAGVEMGHWRLKDRLMAVALS